MRRRMWCLLVPTLVAGALWTGPAAADARFASYEIRVIRPRYFTKARSLELSVGLGTIVNQSFIESFVATGLLTYHFTETLAVEGEGGYAVNADRDDKRRLKNDFGISTVVLTPETLANGRLVWTPSYGKFNITSSRVVYFDTDLTVGVGETAIHYAYDNCVTPRPALTRQYPTYVVGLSQHFFLDKASSLRLAIEDHRLLVHSADGACTDDAEDRIVPHDNLFLFMAWSYYL